ncbi:hypothetical protein C8F01DRAFT_1028755 [Mycena amicta]|nr:hypothetical protein C8F01DRAFT_1028755 [Mycena amicta]
MQTAVQTITTRRRRSCAPRKLECARLCSVQKLRRTPFATKMNETNGAIHTPSKLSLPRVLPRPVLGEVNLALSHSHLGDVPPEYVREKLLGLLPSMRTALSAVKCTVNASRLAKTAQILLNDAVSAHPPTHMLAVYTDALCSSTRAVSLVPVHDIVFAAHCATFPVLPTATSTTDTTSISVPVVPIRLPSPETFSLLHAYLYTQQPSYLRTALKTPCDADGDLLRLAAHAHKVHGLWRNACILGVVDERFYEIVEEAWAQTLSAMQACSS